ncbi:hypothetical protein NCF85_12175 [Qipengyuania citrea]|uniref:Uncharacterized protein n=1 Tax=Qipengyuania citrea TaxID=225971 RepID=A0ABY4U416_9SPHN|nr:hypothetical protein [Qipengyuania citrea]USA60840.1 hypothetical protein NCF85_12175 [Qipengyuania citrea]
MFTQLQTPLPVHVIGKGAGLAFAVIDYGAEHNLIWVTALDEGGEIWCAPNPNVRVAENWSLGRSRDSIAGADSLAAPEGDTP